MLKRECMPLMTGMMVWPVFMLSSTTMTMQVSISSWKVSTATVASMLPAGTLRIQLV